MLQVVASRIVMLIPKRLVWLVAICVALGNPLVALGITTSHIGLPVWISLHAPSSTHPVYRSRLGADLSGIATVKTASGNTSPAGAVGPVAWHGHDAGDHLRLGRKTRLPTMTISEMLQWHAPLNVFGFGLCALIGWMLADAHRT